MPLCPKKIFIISSCSLKPELSFPVANRKHYLGSGAFLFNNKQNTLVGRDWDFVKNDKLWSYRLHYQDWLLEDDCPVDDWVNKWIDDNSPFKGNGWEAYPISLRMVTWIKLLAQGRLSDSAKIRLSLAQQASVLYARREYHLLGNHLLENLFALYLVSHVCCKTSQQQIIYDQLVKEIDAQFLADGGHYELSPMYHAILLERILDILNLTRNRPLSQNVYGKLIDVAHKGLNWL
ncbi:MAG TPA: heparinase II/III family protein, partial [bacterium]|nr:heparinase II/III family protein [bacterium]